MPPKSIKSIARKNMQSSEPIFPLGSYSDSKSHCIAQLICRTG